MTSLHPGSPSDWLPAQQPFSLKLSLALKASCCVQGTHCHAHLRHFSFTALQMPGSLRDDLAGKKPVTAALSTRHEAQPALTMFKPSRPKTARMCGSPA